MERNVLETKYKRVTTFCILDFQLKIRADRGLRYENQQFKNLISIWFLTIAFRYFQKLL